MDRFLPGDRVIVRDFTTGNDVEVEVDGTWGIADGRGNATIPYRVWVIMADRTVRVYEKHEVRHVEAIKDAESKQGG